MTQTTSNTANTRAEFWRGVRESLPIALGFVPFALVLGASAVQSGMAAWLVPLMTGANFAGGSEFAAVALWRTPLDTGLIVAMSVLVNSRHLIMSASFSLLLKNLPRHKALAALFFMCDEAWAMGMNEAREHHRKNLNLPYYFGTAALLYGIWVGFTALGALFGPQLGNLHDYGFDMAFIAVFLMLLKGMWRGLTAAKPWAVSLIVAGALYHTIDGAWYVAGGALAGLLAAFYWSKNE